MAISSSHSSSILRLLKPSTYGMFITSLITLLISITLLILEIAFNYVGNNTIVNTNSLGFNLLSCLDPYLVMKYSQLSTQILIAFIVTCISVAVLVVLVVLSLLRAKTFYSLMNSNQVLKNNNFNNQQHYSSDQLMFNAVVPQLLTKTKLCVEFILASIGVLGNVICFGLYLSFIVDAKHNIMTCSFVYSEKELLPIVILSGVMLLGFILNHVFLFMIRAVYYQHEQHHERHNKYKEMLNLTEEPGINHNTQHYYTEQNLYDNNNHNKQHRNHSILNSQQSFGSKNKKETFQQYRSKQLNELISKKTTEKPSNSPKQNIFNNTEHNINDDNYNRSPKNQQVLKFYKKSNTNKSSKIEQKLSPKNNNKYNPSKFVTTQQTNEPPRRVDTFGNQNGYSSNHYSPIKILNERNDKEKHSSSPKLKYENSPKIQNKNSPELKPYSNVNSYRPQESYRGEEQDTRGQLVFYRGLSKSRKQDTNSNNFKGKIINNRPNQSSGEVSFKSPSRFETKFAEEQSDYLRRNVKNSILPSNGIKQVAGGSRKNIFDDRYSSSGMGTSNFGQSRNIDLGHSNTKSNSKTREGVLTSFIRGKFS